jgi:hypothetical protein
MCIDYIYIYIYTHTLKILNCYWPHLLITKKKIKIKTIWIEKYFGYFTFVFKIKKPKILYPTGLLLLLFCLKWYIKDILIILL